MSVTVPRSRPLLLHLEMSMSSSTMLVRDDQPHVFTVSCVCQVFCHFNCLLKFHPSFPLVHRSCDWIGEAGRYYWGSDGYNDWHKCQGSGPRHSSCVARYACKRQRSYHQYWICGWTAGLWKRINLLRIQGCSGVNLKGSSFRNHRYGDPHLWDQPR